jgi:hypothetical protein
LPSLHGSLWLAKAQPLSALQPSAVQGLPSSHLAGLPALHWPSLQVSPTLQALPSLHGRLLAVWVQATLGSHESVVHGLPSSHGGGTPGTQLPPWHLSSLLQALPSSHGPVVALNWQPSLASQLSAVHGLPSWQVSAGPAAQLPLAQVSPLVHRSPSLQGRALFWWLQPSLASQLSSVQGFLSSQSPAWPGTQLPWAHTSPWVHTLLSLQAAWLGALEQPDLLSHLSSVHGLPSSHLTAAPGAHFSSAHWSPLVQASPSLQGALLALWTQPLLASQLSVLQGLLSSHSPAAPGTQAPPLHASPVVQALPSLQVASPGRAVQPVLLSQLSMVQGLLSSHAVALPPPQLPSAHCSALVQALPSLHGPPLGLAVQPL